ncbi:protein of unknown function [Petrocella atlantisensis]|uniref:Uncharacterized protein n=1 Tax=Petrocella atlantisensis TaxID=2173034 RepID=A0A3P7RVR1_9FIRM|nr:protein of unknown function [Petrocella atlantisensis]
MRLPVPPLRHNKKWFNIHIRRSGRNRARTCDPLLVRQVLSQLSYAPWDINILKLMTTQKGLEPSTSAVTGRRSNQLSHWAIICHYFTFFTFPSTLRWSYRERFASLLELSHWAIICHYFTFFTFPSTLRWSYRERFASLLELSHWAIICHYFTFFTFPSTLRWSYHVRFASLQELSHWAIICHYTIFHFSHYNNNYNGPTGTRTPDHPVMSRML